jgi:hypothetical protein
VQIGQELLAQQIASTAESPVLRASDILQLRFVQFARQAGVDRLSSAINTEKAADLAGLK